MIVPAGSANATLSCHNKNFSASYISSTDIRNHYDQHSNPTNINFNLVGFSLCFALYAMHILYLMLKNCCQMCSNQHNRYAFFSLPQRNLQNADPLLQINAEHNPAPVI